MVNDNYTCRQTGFGVAAYLCEVYEDLNDHGALRGDALLPLLMGKRDLAGEKRKRESERG